MSEQTTTPTRRFTGIATIRVKAGGGYDEWFELVESVSTGDVMAARRKVAAYVREHPEVDDEERREMVGAETFATSIKAWSFLNPDGSPMPITRETVMALPSKVILPAFTIFQDGQKEQDFLDPSVTLK